MIQSKVFVLSAVITTMLTACSVKDKNENTHETQVAFDTLNYSKKDYDLMREFYADSLFQSKLNEGVIAGDTTSFKIKKLLATEYESRSETGMTESEINAMILSSYISKQVMNKFDEIEKGLPKENAADVKKKMDSVVNAIENFEKKLKED